MSEESVVSHWRKLTNAALLEVRARVRTIEHLKRSLGLTHVFLLSEADRTLPAAGSAGRGHSSSG